MASHVDSGKENVRPRVFGDHGTDAVDADLAKKLVECKLATVQEGRTEHGSTPPSGQLLDVLPLEILQQILRLITVTQWAPIATTSTEFASAIGGVMLAHRAACDTLGSCFRRARFRLHVAHLRKLRILRDDLSLDEHRGEVLSDIENFCTHLIALFEYRDKIVARMLQAGPARERSQELRTLVPIDAKRQELEAFRAAGLCDDNAALERRVYELFEMQTSLHSECRELKAEMKLLVENMPA